MQQVIYEHKFGKDFSIEGKGCLRCSNYAGYGFYKLHDLPDGKVQYGTRVICKVSECQPSLKPISCNYCDSDLLKSLESVTDEELKQDLKELGMCSRCHEYWRFECLCALCHFDYPSSSRIKGKKGNYCFCQGCEWYEQCPEKQKSFLECSEMVEITKEKVDRIMEFV